MDWVNGIVALIFAFVVALILVKNIRRFTVFEYERGLLYRNGKFVRVLEPGRHWLFAFSDSAFKADMRARPLTLAGQEILTSDNVSIKISLVVNYKIEDVRRAIHTVANYQEALYLALQVQLRELVSAAPVDELLAKRQTWGEQLVRDCQDKANALGLTLLAVGIKDIMFPGELKNIFAQVVNARNAGLAALERARGESAALRNLANAAQMLENNPALLQLRLLQTLSASSGNTIVLKLPDGEMLMDASAKRKPSSETGQVK